MGLFATVDVGAAEWCLNDGMNDQPSEVAAELPKDAATVVVLRPGPGVAGATDRSFEVFCVRRHAQSAFLGGVVVFPGGKLDEGDGDARFRQLCNGVHPRTPFFADTADHARALAVCACRESLEEAALLPSLTARSASEITALRAQWLGGTGEPPGPPFVELVGDHDLQLDTASLVPFARWITPVGERRRYDTRFFLTSLPAGQLGHHDEQETVSSVWASPGQLLAAYGAGALFLAPPTIRALALLSACADVDSALALCADQSLKPICPEFVPGDPPMLALPGDPNHSVAERRVAGPTRFVVRDGLFVAEDP